MTLRHRIPSQEKVGRQLKVEQQVKRESVNSCMTLWCFQGIASVSGDRDNPSFGAKVLSTGAGQARNSGSVRSIRQRLGQFLTLGRRCELVWLILIQKATHMQGKNLSLRRRIRFRPEVALDESD